MHAYKSLKLAAGAAAIALAAAASAQPTVENTVKVAPGGLYEVIFNPADNDLYVAATGPRGAQGAAAVARIDGKSLAEETPIKVAEAPLFGLGLNAKTQTLYGTATRSNLVSAIDLKTGQVVGTIRNGDETAHLRQVIVDEAANKAYASVYGGTGREAGGRPSQLWVIDGSDNTLDRVVPVDANGFSGIALDPANNRLFGTAMDAHEVVVIDLATDKITARWPTGTERPTNVVYDPAGKRLFVVSQASADLAVMNADTGQVIRKVPTGEGALSVAYNPAVNQIYVANRQAGTVTVIDSNSYDVLGNLEVGTFPQTIAIDRATNTVYVTNKARGLPRGAPAGTPVPDDPGGDTLTLIRP